jgi:GNAT superfamily N-acetyltransferase
MITTSIAQSDSQFEQILALQRRYQRQALTVEEQNEKGFVHTEHDVPLLRRMAAELPQAIAEADDRVVGYCLSLPVSLRNEQPKLESMFVQFNQCSYRGRPLSSYRFYVGGQVCVDRDFRGHGLLGRLYHEVRRCLPTPYDLCVTEIATRNQVSVRAHLKIGFQPLMTFSDGSEEWVIVGWNLVDSVAHDKVSGSEYDRAAQ